MTKDFDKGTDESEDMKKAVVTIHRKGLDKFEGHSNGSTVWFKLDSGFLKRYFLLFIQNSMKNFLKIILKIKTHNFIQRLLHHLIKNILRKNMKKGSNMITQLEELTPEEIVVHKYRSN